MIALATDFAYHALIVPFKNLCMLTSLTMELLAESVEPSSEFLYSQICLITWILAFINSLLTQTLPENNLKIFEEFNSTVRDLSLNSTYFFGNVSADSGMSYIAKNAYLAMKNPISRERMEYVNETAISFANALNSTIYYMAKVLEQVK